MRLFFITTLCTLLIGITSMAEAEPIAVRFTEGTTHGYLSLKTEQGRQIAHGELVQRTRGKRVEANLLFYFLDGSVHDEKVTFSQHRLFRMEKYFLKQTGRFLSYSARSQELIERQEHSPFVLGQPVDLKFHVTGRSALPDDVYNGMIVTLLKNLTTRSRAQRFNMSPSHLNQSCIHFKLTPTHRLNVKMGARSKPVTQYVLEPKVGLDHESSSEKLWVSFHPNFTIIFGSTRMLSLCLEHLRARFM